MPSRLAPCPSCTRHVKVGAASCPFCGGDVPTEVPLRVFPARGGKPLTRAAILFAGAAAVTACGEVASSPAPVSNDGSFGVDAAPPARGFDSSMPPPPPPPPGDDESGGLPVLYGPAAVVDAMVGQVDAAYGGFVRPDATFDFDSGGPVAAYGGFARPDAGIPEPSEDAGQGFAAYGGFVRPDSGGGH